ncbi:Flagellar assembly protein FliH [Buchnera aphidicola (Thelaxes suberi)]|uniref:FliH/SctL family protein n=1 Tax=Buchnera aphidicola TaxID=9 RepID=UPI0034648A60
MIDKVNKKWKKWNPTEIYQKKNIDFYHEDKVNTLKNIFSKKYISKIDYNSKNDSFFNKKKNNQNVDQFQLGLKKGKSIGFAQGFEKGIAQSSQLEKKIYKKIDKIFFEFQQALNDLDSVFSDHLLNLSLVVLRDIIGISSIDNREFLFNKIKKIIYRDFTTALNKTILFHPENKHIIEKRFKNLIKLYNWNIAYNNSIPNEGCKIITNLGSYDETLTGLWKELYRIAKSEEQ